MKKTLFTLFFLKSLLLSACLSPGAQPATGSDAAVSGGSTTTAPAGSEETVPGSAGSAVGGGESAASGAVARAGDGGGIVGAPSSREGIQTALFKVKMLYWKPDARRPWRDAADFFDKLNRGVLTDEAFAGAEVIFGMLESQHILEERDGEWGGYLGVDERMVRTEIIDKLTEPGYSLVFMAVRENFFGDKEGEVKAPRHALTTAEEAKAFVNDPEGRFVGERFIPPFGIHPELIRSHILFPVTLQPSGVSP